MHKYARINTCARTHTHLFICLFIYFKAFKSLELLPLQCIRKKTTFAEFCIVFAVYCRNCLAHFCNGCLSHTVVDYDL